VLRRRSRQYANSSNFDGDRERLNPFFKSELEMTKSTGRERSFLAGMLQFAVDAEGQRSATFYIMNTSKNRNRWAVTDKALEEGLPTLKGKPIGMGADYKIDKHYPEGQTLDSGKFVSTEKPGAYALGTASITDDQTWNMMQAGKLGPVSVVLFSYQDTCSKCGADLSGLEDPFGGHSCLSVKDSSAFIQVESFKFKRVDFVDVPAYPQAGLQEMSGKASSSAEGYTRALELLAGVYESQEPPVNEAGITKIGVKKDLPEKNENEIVEKLANLEQQYKKLQTDYEAAKAETKTATEDAKTLKAKFDALEKARHDGLVADTLKARADAGLAGKEEADKTFLAALSDDALAVLKADALKVASITQKQASVPSVKYEAKSGDSLEAAIKECRADFGFAPQKEVK
jgi:LysM repeat protein